MPEEPPPKTCDKWALYEGEPRRKPEPEPGPEPERETPSPPPGIERT